MNPTSTTPGLLSGIVESPLFAEHTAYYRMNEPWASGLVNAAGLALFRLLIPSIAAKNVVEIGTNKGWTAYVMAAAMEDAGLDGIVHTVGPYDAERFLPVYETWSENMKKHVRFYPENSAAFFQDAIAKHDRFELIFVDGNHDYEFALFDIQCAARVVTPGGYVVIDNIDLSDVHRAAAQFLATASGHWLDCRDSSRSDFLSGQFMAVLRAPPQ
jgi:predicted O-methyltransferase YrrM